MTQKEKDLLLKDLCGRLPYGVICFKEITNCMPANSVLLEEDVYSFRTGKPTVADYGQHDYYETVVLEIMPYLRPISSMTEEESEEYWTKINNDAPEMPIDEIPSIENIAKCSEVVLDWLNSHHFDYRGLIEKGLALEAPENMYKF